MIKLYIILLIISSAMYFILFKLALWHRITIVLLSFIIPAIIITFLIVHTGDKPTPGARTIKKEMLNTGDKEDSKNAP